MSTPRIAGLAGFLAVSLGAFGAHALKGQLLAAGTQELWHTAVSYHLAHAACLAALCFAPHPLPPALKVTRASWALGILVFSGTLYAMALGAPRWLGAVTPVGGICLLVGWAALAFARNPGKERSS